ncbi:MAG: hypothetical protein FWD60_10080, partial [Candidatus Azobacteroides sp.]|nr:hypothetical protein [Candidatus Azobacteroides sp.]
MKKIVGFFIVLILSTWVYSVTAQTEQSVQSNGQDTQNTLRQLVAKKAYGDNWFVSLGGNVNLLTSEEDGDAPMMKRIKFGGGLTLGKWFTENFGARIQVMGGSLRGFNYVERRGDGYYVWSNYNHQDVPMGCNIDGVRQGNVWDYSDQSPFTTNIHYDANGNPFYFPVRYHLISNKGKAWDPQNPVGPGPGFWQDFNYASATVDLMANFTNLFRGYDSGHNL